MFGITGSTDRVGCIVQEVDGDMTIIDNNNGNSQTGSGSAHYSRAEPHNSTTDHLALNVFAVIADTDSVDGTAYFNNNGFGIVNFY